MFGSLGVVFDLSLISKRTFTLSHRDVRREELAETLETLLTDDCYKVKTTERLRGRLLWFENFVCGRQANILVARLGKFVNGVRHMQQLPDELKETLVHLLNRVKSCAPTQISTKLFSTWICFTDGACEGRASVGAVLVDPAGRAAFTFEGELPPVRKIFLTRNPNTQFTRLNRYHSHYFDFVGRTVPWKSSGLLRWQRSGESRPNQGLWCNQFVQCHNWHLLQKRSWTTVKDLVLSSSNTQQFERRTKSVRL